MPPDESIERTDADPPRLPRAIPLAAALRFWLRLGFVSFGGPAGQIALMHDELVQRVRWISERRYLHALNYCMLLPGPEAQQLATYLGWLMHGTWGGIAAGVLFVLPSLVLLIALSWLYVAYAELPLLAAVFYGIKPAVTAIVLHAGVRIASRSLKHGSHWVIAAAAFVALAFGDVPFPVIVVCAALLGVLCGRVFPEAFGGSSHATAMPNREHGQAVIDDDTPRPRHAQFRPRRALAVMGIGGVLWLVPMATLLLTFGWRHDFTQMGWFFTKAALLTFGGAYAVLPYVYQGAVEHYGWLTPRQMIDGLALGESTPGPLIMVVAFVAFVGAHGGALLGVDARPESGVLAALLVTWFTFLPSFVFVLLGGPFVESTQGNLRFTAPLAGISAAVVGVIANLGLFFAYHTLWPQGSAGSVEWPAVGIMVCAAIALIWLRLSVLVVLLGAAVLGLLLQFAS